MYFQVSEPITTKQNPDEEDNDLEGVGAVEDSDVDVN
jgi:hypothetical protein